MFTRQSIRLWIFLSRATLTGFMFRFDMVSGCSPRILVGAQLYRVCNLHMTPSTQGSGPLWAATIGHDHVELLGPDVLAFWIARGRCQDVVREPSL